MNNEVNEKRDREENLVELSAQLWTKLYEKMGDSAAVTSEIIRLADKFEKNDRYKEMAKEEYLSAIDLFVEEYTQKNL